MLKLITKWINLSQLYDDAFMHVSYYMVMHVYCLLTDSVRCTHTRFDGGHHVASGSALGCRGD